MSWLLRQRLLLLLSLRNLTAHRTKSIVVGGILFCGTLLVVVGGSLLGSVQRSMAQSITSSLAGQLQVYSKDAPDPLELFGSFSLNQADVGEIPDFGKVEDVLRKVPHVQAIVPMGITTSTVFGQGELEQVLGDMRDAVRDGDPDRAAALIPRVKQVAKSLLEQQAKRRAIASDPAKVEAQTEALQRVLSDDLWAGWTDDPYRVLDFLDTEVAPIAGDGELYYLRVIGTDLHQFGERFDRFYIVDGKMVPPGHRGFLFSKRTYEHVIKNPVARGLDDVHHKVVKDGETIADSPILQEAIERNADQYPRIVYQLAPKDAQHVKAALQQLLGEQGDLEKLVQDFLHVDDANLAQRYDFFYKEIAPRIRLYSIPVGSTITLRAYTKSGYLRSVNVPIYGTYEFRGLEDSDLATASNLMDLVSFREIYGKMSAQQRAELGDIEQSVGVKDVDRADAESALFGGGGDVQTASAGDTTKLDQLTAGTLQRERAITDTFDEQKVRRGLVLNAAILLDDPSRTAEVRQDIQRTIDANDLNLQVVGWQQAAGIYGQFLMVMQGVLLIALLVIFLVALIIVNNAMVMATTDRVQEIGTMRAIGAQRGMVIGMFLWETALLSLVAGGAGALAGAGIVAWLGHLGIPAVADVLVLLFAGPRLYPSIALAQVALGIAAVVAVGLLSTLYPAFLGARVQPVVAMHGRGE